MNKNDLNNLNVLGDSDDEKMWKNFIYFSSKINWSPKADKDLLKNRYTCYPIDLLKKILNEICEKEYEIPKKDSLVEFAICLKLGLNPLDWQEVLRDKYKKGLLSRELYNFTMPYFKSEIIELYSDMISDAVKQYIEVYENVQLLGPFEKNQNINLKLEKNKEKFACFLNTSDGSGSHWVALYIDINQNTIEYFDSMGFEPNNQMKKDIDKILKTIRKEFPNLTFFCHFGNELCQTSGADCGIYCTHFLIYKIMNKGSIYDFIETELTPKAISSLKKVYWNII